MTARRFVAACVLFAACSKHEVSDLTPWLRVDVQRPRDENGVIRIGSRQETWQVKIGNRWQKLGVGNGGGYAILGEEALTATTAVVSLGHGHPLLVRPDAAPRALEGIVYYPNALNVDVFTSSDRDAKIKRYDATGNESESFSVSIPSAYSDCRITGLRGYFNSVPYVDTICNPSSTQARCLVIEAGKQQTVHVVKPDQPQSDCNFPRLHLMDRFNAYRRFD